MATWEVEDKVKEYINERGSGEKGRGLNEQGGSVWVGRVGAILLWTSPC